MQSAPSENETKARKEVNSDFSAKDHQRIDGYVDYAAMYAATYLHVGVMKIPLACVIKPWEA